MNSNTVVVYPHLLRDAALYFDYCVPVFPTDSLTPDHFARLQQILTGKRGRSQEEVVHNMRRFMIDCYDCNLSVDVIDNLLPPGCGEVYNTFLAMQFAYVTGMFLALHEDPKSKKLGFEAMAMFDQSLQSLPKELGLDHVPFLSSLRPPETSEQGDPVVTVSGLKFIRSGGLSWSQILELRQNKDARKKLKRMRDFVRREYVGKSPDEIRDSIEVVIEDYEELAKSEGLSLLESTLSVVKESPTVLSLAAVLTVSAGDLKVAVAGAGALVVELGRLLLTIGKAANQRRSAIATHPLVYLVQRP